VHRAQSFDDLPGACDVPAMALVEDDSEVLLGGCPGRERMDDVAAVFEDRSRDPREDDRRGHGRSGDCEVSRAYAHGAGADPLIGQTIGEDLSETARGHPDADALIVVHQNVRLTYAEFDREVDRVARGLLALGVQDE
jgi:non-ribosomal peptide synthetase component F